MFRDAMFPPIGFSSSLSGEHSKAYASPGYRLTIYKHLFLLYYFFDVEGRRLQTTKFLYRSG